MSKQMSVNRIRIPLKGGGEHDIHSPWRKVLCYAKHVTKYYKRKYNKRFRKQDYVTFSIPFGPIVLITGDDKNE